MKQLTLAASVLVVALLLMLSVNVQAGGGKISITQSQGRRSAKKLRATKAAINYSQFSHRTHVDAKKPACDSCHKFPTANWKDVRQGDAAFPDVAEFPQHESCCHELGRYERPSQTARAFRVGFSHAQHNHDERLGCSDCHRIRGGFQTNEVAAPQPLNHHAARGSFSCMSCHNGKRAFGGDDFSVCNRCHKGSAWHF